MSDSRVRAHEGLSQIMKRKIKHLTLFLPPYPTDVMLNKGYEILLVKGDDSSRRIDIYIGEPETTGELENVQFILRQCGDWYEGSDKYISSVRVNGGLWHVFERKLD